jgi:excisionase family DNA binding protein
MDNRPETAGIALTAVEAAAYLGVHERTIRRAIARGDLTATKEGGQFRIAADALDEFQARHGDGGAWPGDRQTAGRAPPSPAIFSAPKLVIVGSELLSRPPLPRPLDTLVGREREVNELQGLLRRSDVRLLTLTGPGVVGKTRLALAVAAGIEDAFADGAAFVSLAAIVNADLVLPAIARALGLRDAADHSLAEDFGTALRRRELLLVIDNFEQVIAAAPAVADLLSVCPGLTILVTSREPLRLGCEYRYPISPLSIPTKATHPTVEDLADFAGVTLFLDRARRVRRDFALNAENAATVAAICARLDGLPLAIELAAAWIGTLSAEDLRTRLEHRLPLLTGGNRDLPDRQRTMRDAVAWSYDLLTEEEQRCFRQLSVFVGGFTLDAAEWVAGVPSPPTPDLRPPTPDSVLHLVDALIAKNLLVSAAATTDSATMLRFGMLETVREFALERLAASGEEEETRERHASWAIQFGDDAWRTLWQQPLRLADLDRVEAEHDNLRAALGWLADAGDGGRALRLTTSLTPFWYLHSHRMEGLARLRRALSLAPAESIPTNLAARGSYCIALLSDNVEEVHPALLESMRLLRASGDRWEIAIVLHFLAIIASVNGRHDEATTLGEEALTLFASLKKPERISDLQCILGRAAYARGQIDRAFRLLTASLQLAREVDDPYAIGQALNALALVNVDRGDLGPAATHFGEALSTWLEVGSKDGIATSLAGVATLATIQHAWEVAAHMFGAISAMQIQVGFDPRVERVRHARAEREAAVLGGASFAAAVEAGSAMPSEVAIAEAIAYLARAVAVASPSQPGQAIPYGLSQRELDVLRQIAAGLNDREIADALYISRHTVMRHVSSILTKLEVGSRTAATAVAVRDGLV